MKKFRKVISAVLALAMLMSVGGIMAVADATTITDVDPNTNEGRAVNELVKLGIVDGYEDGTFRPDQTITRGEFTKLIITFKGIADAASENLESGFEDVDGIGHWAKKYIKLAFDQGIINGYEDGTFRPDAPVRYNEAVKMLVASLGYELVAQQRNQAEGSAWYTGYMSVASERGMLRNAVINSYEDSAPRGTVAILMYNSLSVSVATVGSGGKVTIKDNSTALEELLNKTEVSGIVTGVWQTGLYSGATGLAERNITVSTSDGDVAYKVSASDFNRFGETTYPLLGRRINAYAEKNNFDDFDDISNIGIDSRQNELTVIKPEDIYSISSRSISYYPDKNSSARKTISFVNDIQNMTVIYNGKHLPNPTLADLEGVRSGNITLLSNDSRHGDAEVIFITSYEIFVVSSRTTNSSTKVTTIYSLYGAGSIEMPEADNHVSITRDGKDIAATAINTWDVLSVARSRENSAGKPVFNCIVTRDKKDGEVTETEVDSGGTKVKIGNNNNFYYFSYLFRDYNGAKPAFNLGERVTVYLDHEGKIAAADATAENVNIYVGYLAYAENKDTFNSKGQIRMYGVSGSLGNVLRDLAPNVRLDGVTISNDHDEVLSKLRASAAAANAGKVAFDETFGLTEYAQLIRYTLNSRGEADMIDTIMPNANPSNDDLVQSLPFPASAGRTNGEYTYVSGSQFVDSSNSIKMMVKDTTKIVSIPQVINNTFDGFALKNYSNAFSTSTSYRVEGYNVSSGVDIAGYILVYGGSSDSMFNELSDIVMAKEISEVEGSSGLQDKITGWNVKNGAAVTNLLADEGVLNNTVQPGEIFRYTKTPEGDIDEIDWVLEIENGRPVFGRDEDGDRLAPVSSAAEASSRRVIQYDKGKRTESASLARFFYGTVVGKDNSGNNVIISVTNALSTDDMGITENIRENFTITPSAKVMMYDFSASRPEDKLLEDVSLDTIRTKRELEEANLNADGASQVLIFVSSNSVKTIVIFKY